MMPCTIDRDERRMNRKWALRNYWGPICWWCSRMQSTRYSYLNSAGFLKFLESAPEHKEEAALASLAYISLREEGKVHISAAMVDIRCGLLRRMATMVPQVLSESHYEVVPLQNFKDSASYGNPVERNLKIVQVRDGSDRRLGVMTPCPRQDSAVSLGLCARACMSASVQTDAQEDADLLLKFIEAAPVAPKATEVVSRSPMKKSRSSAADGSLAEAGDDEDDAKEEEDEDDEPKSDCDDFEYPRGRLGTGVRKMESKLSGILASMTSPQWRIPFKEPAMRAILRTAAGSKVELESSEHPLMVARNAEHTNIATKLLELTLGLISVDKDDSARNLAKLSSPLGALVEILRARRPKARFDAEVMLLKVIGRCGGAL